MTRTRRSLLLLLRLLPSVSERGDELCSSSGRFALPRPSNSDPAVCPVDHLSVMITGESGGEVPASSSSSSSSSVEGRGGSGNSVRGLLVEADVELRPSALRLSILVVDDAGKGRFPDSGAVERAVKCLSLSLSIPLLRCGLLKAKPPEAEADRERLRGRSSINLCLVRLPKVGVMSTVLGPG